VPLVSRISSSSTHSFDFYKAINVDNLSDISSVDNSMALAAPTNKINPTKQSTNAPRPESLIDKQFSFLNHTDIGSRIGGGLGGLSPPPVFTVTP